MDAISAGGTRLVEAFIKALFNKWLDKRYTICVLNTQWDFWEITIRERNDKTWNKLPLRRIKYDGKSFHYYSFNEGDPLAGTTRSCDVLSQMDEFWRDCLRPYAKKEFKRRRSLPVFI